MGRWIIRRWYNGYGTISLLASRVYISSIAFFFLLLMLGCWTQEMKGMGLCFRFLLCLPEDCRVCGLRMWIADADANRDWVICREVATDSCRCVHLFRTALRLYQYCARHRSYARRVPLASALRLDLLLLRLGVHGGGRRLLGDYRFRGRIGFDDLALDLRDAVLGF